MGSREITFPFAKRNHGDIEWNGAVYWTRNYNPWTGCFPISPACEHCYARTISERFNQKFEPRKTKKQNPPSSGIVFCGNSTDLFGHWIENSELTKIFNKVIHKSCNMEKDCQYLFLTKRTKRMSHFICHAYHDGGIAKANIGNIYLGFTAESQEWYDRRLEDCDELLGIFPMWLSCEPLLGKIDLHLDALKEKFNGGLPFRWVVVGAESGKDRRQCDIDWIYDIVKQCREHEVPVFVKQIHNREMALVQDIKEFPPHLQYRHVPWVSDFNGK